MSHSIRLMWKIFAPMQDGVATYAPGLSSLFDVRRSGTFLSDIGGTIQTDFCPFTLDPTKLFLSNTQTRLKAFGIARGRAPYLAPLGDAAGAASIDVNAGLHVYGRDVCLSLECEPFEVENLDRIQALRELSNHAALMGLARTWMAVATSNDRRALPQPRHYRVFPCISIRDLGETPPPDDRLLASLLTKHPQISKAVETQVLEKNRTQQIDETSILLDRQGIVGHAPALVPGEQWRGHARRLRSCMSMLEMVAAMQRLFMSPAPDQTLLQQARQAVHREAKALLPNSTSAQHAWRLLNSEFELVGLSAEVRVHNEEGTSLNQTNNTAANAPRRSVLCVAAATVEMAAVKRALTVEFGQGKLKPFADDFGVLFHDGATDVDWMLVASSFQAQVETASYVPSLIADLRPTIVLMVGMCMGMPEAALPPGTVVVPNEVFNLDHRREVEAGTEYRPHGERVAKQLYKLADILGPDVTDYKVETRKGLASSSAKIENPSADVIALIAHAFPDVAAVDMEGFAFYRATERLPALWIKAVADRGEAPAPSAGGQEAKRSTQAAVVENAIDFAIRVARAFFDAAAH
ncbi:hypothetical protein [Scleromatobacter humisilvae]|uniref:Nucleoside phosphorylase domain-containing protein n=1 Tax=Scleromatobacter humisilvae TaxID=2897159 RepID=A0A9X1YPL7_9BURK|nr:hypothetical protein [Scleromatobacter humisilvae]MCK9685476.1 hypothetical protein [Scleromatobacter humisilvae]